MAWLRRVVSSQMLEFKGFEMLCEYKRVKYLRLKFTAQGEFKLSVPLSYSKSQILDFLNKNDGWIYEKYTKFNENKAAKQGKIEFLGRIYELKFDENLKKVRVLPSAFLGGNSGEFTAFGENSSEFTRKNSSKFTAENSAFNENLGEFKQNLNSQNEALNSADRALGGLFALQNEENSAFDEKFKQNSGKFTAFGENSSEFTEKNSAFSENSSKFTAGNSAFDENLGEFTRKNSAKFTHENSVFNENPSKFTAENLGEFTRENSAFDENFKQNLNSQKDIKGVIIAPNERVLEAFLRANALKIFVYYIKKWRGHFTADISRISVKKMHTRWGSCNSRKGYINLNLRLIAKPLKAIEYVVLHELTHLKFPHHKASFWAQIHALMPDYKAREKMLKGKFA